MHWQNFLNNTMKSFSNLSKEIPETFKGFETMGKEAKKNGALDEKTKEKIWAQMEPYEPERACVGPYGLVSY